MSKRPFFRPRTPRGRVLFFVTMFLVLDILGTFGYHLIEGWGLIDSFYTVLINVIAFGGIGDISPRTVAGRLFTVVLKAFSLVIWGGIVYSAMQTLISQRVEQVTT